MHWWTVMWGNTVGWDKEWEMRPEVQSGADFLATEVMWTDPSILRDQPVPGKQWELETEPRGHLAQEGNENTDWNVEEADAWYTSGKEKEMRATQIGRTAYDTDPCLWDPKEHTHVYVYMHTHASSSLHTLVWQVNSKVAEFQTRSMYKNHSHLPTCLVNNGKVNFRDSIHKHARMTKGGPGLTEEKYDLCPENCKHHGWKLKETK